MEKAGPAQLKSPSADPRPLPQPPIPVQRLQQPLKRPQISAAGRRRPAITHLPQAAPLSAHASEQHRPLIGPSPRSPASSIRPRPPRGTCSGCDWSSCPRGHAPPPRAGRAASRLRPVEKEREKLPPKITSGNKMAAGSRPAEKERINTLSLKKAGSEVQTIGQKCRKKEREKKKEKKSVK